MNEKPNLKERILGSRFYEESFVFKWEDQL